MLIFICQKKKTTVHSVFSDLDKHIVRQSDCVALCIYTSVFAAGDRGNMVSYRLYYRGMENKHFSTNSTCWLSTVSFCPLLYLWHHHPAQLVSCVNIYYLYCCVVTLFYCTLHNLMVFYYYLIRFWEHCLVGCCVCFALCAPSGSCWVLNFLPFSVPECTVLSIWQSLTSWDLNT